MIHYASNYRPARRDWRDWIGTVVVHSTLVVVLIIVGVLPIFV